MNLDNNMTLNSARQHVQLGVSSLLERASGRLYEGAEFIVNDDDQIIKTLEVSMNHGDESHHLVLLVKKSTGAEYIMAINLDSSTLINQFSTMEFSDFSQQCVNHGFPHPSTVQVVIYFCHSMTEFKRF